MNRKFEVLSDSASSEDELVTVPNKKFKTSSQSASSSSTEINFKDVAGTNETDPNQKILEANNSGSANKKKKGLKRTISEQEKQLAKNIKKVLKSTNKEECIKNIIIIINRNTLEQEYGDAIKKILKENNISIKLREAFPNFITWDRKIQTIEDMCIKESEATEKHALLILPAKTFSSLVGDKALTSYIKERISEIKCEHITVAIYGVHKPTTLQEQAVLELEMYINCHLQFFKGAEPLATFILMITKSVALIPYKKSDEEKYKSQNLYLNEFKKDTVRVDQNGNGLGRLWHQMLTMFPLARLETAEAITAAYPTPAALFKGYGSCQEKDTMLQNIDVRRAHGPLTANRRIGPEMSRKAGNFFTATVNRML